MDSQEIHECIAEFGKIRQDAGRDEAALMEVALFVEDLFGIVLSDDEICEENLGAHNLTEKFVMKKLDPEGICAEFVE
ncbi:MAG: hypothetical protein B1H11_11745 [Desulfobacteraceae bacterium 4484_190.1]|nr:MAG: hypothetical protein B1H11_11745 [Desulfobacteraceae bacterium 4484_190.1]